MATRWLPDPSHAAVGSRRRTSNNRAEVVPFDDCEDGFSIADCARACNECNTSLDVRLECRYLVMCGVPARNGAARVIRSDDMRNGHPAVEIRATGNQVGQDLVIGVWVITQIEHDAE